MIKISPKICNWKRIWVFNPSASPLKKKLFKKCFWLPWVFVGVCGLSLVAASRGHSQSQRMGFSLRGLLLLLSTSSRRAGSVAAVRGLNCFGACGIFLARNQTPVPCIDRLILIHQGGPIVGNFYTNFVNWVMALPKSSKDLNVQNKLVYITHKKKFHQLEFSAEANNKERKWNIFLRTRVQIS